MAILIDTMVSQKSDRSAARAEERILNAITESGGVAGRGDWTPGLDVLLYRRMTQPVSALREDAKKR